MKISLTDSQKKELEIQHDNTRDGRVRDRIKAVLLASEGWSAAMISQECAYPNASGHRNFQ